MAERAGEEIMDDNLKQFLTTTLTAMEERLKAYVKERVEKAETSLTQRIEKTETSLLTEFHHWARPMEIKMRGASTVVFGFDERLAIMEERISELDGRGHHDKSRRACDLQAARPQRPDRPPPVLERIRGCFQGCARWRDFAAELLSGTGQRRPPFPAFVKGTREYPQ